MHTYTREEIQGQFIECQSARDHRLFMTNSPQSSIRLVEEIPPQDGDNALDKDTHCIVVLNDGVESYIKGSAEDFFTRVTESVNRGFTFAKALGEEQMREMQAAQAEGKKKGSGLLVPLG